MGGVYVPFWTFSAKVTSQWTADRGWHYYETEVYVETVNGQQVERTRQVQQTRWEPAYGMRRDHFADVLVAPAARSSTELVDKLSSFDTKLLVPYQPEFLAGWRAESYALDLAPASGIAEQKMARAPGRAVRERRGGRHAPESLGGERLRGDDVQARALAGVGRGVQVQGEGVPVRCERPDGRGRRRRALVGVEDRVFWL